MTDHVIPAAPGTYAISDDGQRRVVVAYRCIGNEATPIMLAENVVLSTDTREQKDNVG